MKALAWCVLWPLVALLWVLELFEGPGHDVATCGCNDCWALRHHEVLQRMGIEW